MYVHHKYFKLCSKLSTHKDGQTHLLLLHGTAEWLARDKWLVQLENYKKNN